MTGTTEFVNHAEIAKLYRGADLAPGLRDDIATAHWRLGAQRSPGQRRVECIALDATTSVVLVVVDDQSLLVEAAVTELDRLHVRVQALLHPVVAVARNNAGQLLSLTPGAPNAEHVIAESWMAFLIPAIDESQRGDVARHVGVVVDQVARVHADTQASRDVLRSVANQLDSVSDTSDADAQLLRWLADDNFLPIGHLQGRGAWATGHGLYADEAFDRPAVHAATNVRLGRVALASAVVHSNYPTAIRCYEPDTGTSHLIVGVFTAAAVHAELAQIPWLGALASSVLTAAGVSRRSYAGSTILALLHDHPGADLFGADPAALAAELIDVSDAVAAREVRVYLNVDPDSCICTARLYVPRDRYTTALREAMQELLAENLGGHDLEYTARVGESPLAFIHVVMRVDTETHTRLRNVDVIHSLRLTAQRDIAAATTTWHDRLAAIANQSSSTDTTAMLSWAHSLPDVYTSAHAPEEALSDAAVLRSLPDGGFDVTLVQSNFDELQWTFSLYLCRRPASLTDVLPMLQSLGVDVLDEHPFALSRSDGAACWIYEFTVVPGASVVVTDEYQATLPQRFTDAFVHMWAGDSEVDQLNELIVRSGIGWHDVAMLRAYYRYLRQCGFGYGTAHVAGVFGDNVEVTSTLVALFAASFDPEGASNTAREAALENLAKQSESILSLDADRVITAFIAVISATVRTSFYLDSTRGGSMAFKLSPRDIPQTPQPRPLHEIFVYSPRVEGVHLRFGAVARGGLRWSDRREDFRTEILGLVKAQAVKNAVIVPVGAKGGFVVKQPPAVTGDDGVDRAAQRDAGIACYREFISGLLDVTDNIIDGKVVPAAGVVRRDPDDTYLVVAADKGTASFSDIANGVAAEYNFWLGDAFASGGSVGYDHKAMGITAKGAWESVRRHFRERQLDVDTDDFTVVGVGDMSGDVFGNGMLLSRHINLVAAFDHRDIFIDPNPHPASSFSERERLFHLPRSSWADYNQDLISPGGGVFSRQAKSISISAEIREALGLASSVRSMSPPELMRAILLAPVDLLWNGGIGTYIKASTQANTDVGDKANDAIRVNGNEIRASVIGEGGNLGVTERGRIEFDLAGGRINTDALDNSAGVDCSDHEVNIKILLDTQVASGVLGIEDRNTLLELMTDDVARHVLDDNVSQNRELGTVRGVAATMHDVHGRILTWLADNEGVDLELEALPTPGALDGRGPDGQRIGLTSPEIATMMAHVKLALKEELLDGELPDNEVFESRLQAYFPPPLQHRYADAIAAHPLKRQIVATTLVNDVVDTAGVHHVFTMCEGTGTSAADAIRAYVAVVEIFNLRHLWQELTAADVCAEVQGELIFWWRRMAFRSSRWMLSSRPQPIAMASEITRYAPRIASLSAKMMEWLGPESTEAIESVARDWIARGVPAGVANAVAAQLHYFCLFDVIDAAEIAERDEEEVAQVYFGLLDHFGIERILLAVSSLPSRDQWSAMARLALRDDLYAALRALTLSVLHVGEPDETAAEKIAEWEVHNSTRIDRARRTLTEAMEAGDNDLATLSVAARQLRSIIR